MTHTAYLSLGSNLGASRRTLQVALADLGLPGQGDLTGSDLPANQPTRVVCVSDLFETEPQGGPSGQASYLNLVVKILTDLAPGELLEFCQSLEAQAGRVRTTRWGPRTLDIDILVYNNETVDLPELQIPHPRMFQRRFVLEPLSQVAPELVTRDIFLATFDQKVRNIGKI